MKKSVLRAHLAAWLLLPPAAALNGTLRDFTYGTAMPTNIAHSISVVPLVAIIGAWAAFLARRRPLPDRRSATLVGVAWLVATVAFETGLDALRGVPIDRLVAEYDVTRGNLWPLVPLATLFAPIVLQRLITPSRCVVVEGAG